MRNDVSLRKIAACTEASLEFTEKTEIDVNAPIFWTIERSGGATREAATGPGLVCEQYQLRFLVFAAHLAKDRMPRVFRIGENDSDELRCLILRRLTVVLRSLR